MLESYLHLVSVRDNPSSKICKLTNRFLLASLAIEFVSHSVVWVFGSTPPPTPKLSRAQRSTQFPLDLFRFAKCTQFPLDLFRFARCVSTLTEQQDTVIKKPHATVLSSWLEVKPQMRMDPPRSALTPTRGLCCLQECPTEKFGTPTCAC